MDVTNLMKHCEKCDVYFVETCCCEEVKTAPQKRIPSLERGCLRKTALGNAYVKQAARLAKKHVKKYGVYYCPHCNGTHLTTKLENSGEYPDLLYVTQ